MTSYSQNQRQRFQLTKNQPFFEYSVGNLKRLSKLLTYHWRKQWGNSDLASFPGFANF